MNESLTRALNRISHDNTNAYWATNITGADARELLALQRNLDKVRATAAETLVLLVRAQAWLTPDADSPATMDTVYLDIEDFLRKGEST